MTGNGAMLSARKDVLLWVIVLAALVIRIGWMLVGAPVMENEGGVYTRTAENLLRGRGFESIYGAPETMYTLLLSVLIAASKFFFHNSDVAARMVAVVSGTLLTLPVYFLSRQMYGRIAGLVGAALVAFSPLLVGFSVAVYTETPYMFFVLSGVYFGLRALELQNARHAALAGLFWGLAYLMRVEGIAYLLLTFIAMWLAAWLSKVDWRIALRHTFTLGVIGMLVASPYIFYLWQHTGQVRLEGKNLINYTIIKRMETGLTYDEAAWGIDENLEEVGPLLTPNHFATYTPYAFSGSDAIAKLPGHAKHNFSVLLESIFPNFAFGSPLLWGFIIIGFFRRRWDRERVVREVWVLAAAGYAVLLLMLAHLILFRYAMPLYPFLIVWASHGVMEFADWVKETLGAVAPKISPSWARHAGLAAIVGGVLGTALFGLMGVRYIEDVKQGFADHIAAKEAGLWLKEHAPANKTVMDVTSHVAYYSDAVFKGYPHARIDLVLRYIEKVKPDYLVVWGASYDKRPYLHDWLESGIPSRNVEQIYESGDSTENRIRIYRWRETPQP